MVNGFDTPVVFFMNFPQLFYEIQYKWWAYNNKISNKNKTYLFDVTVKNTGIKIIKTQLLSDFENCSF